MESANTEPTDYSQWSKEELEYGISKVTFEIIALKRWIAFKREMRETEAVAADEYEEEEISAEDAARDAKREALLKRIAEIHTELTRLGAVEWSACEIFEESDEEFLPNTTKKRSLGKVGKSSKKAAKRVGKSLIIKLPIGMEEADGDESFSERGSRLA